MTDPPLSLLDSKGKRAGDFNHKTEYNTPFTRQTEFTEGSEKKHDFSSNSLRKKKENMRSRRILDFRRSLPSLCTFTQGTTNNNFMDLSLTVSDRFPTILYRLECFVILDLSLNFNRYERSRCGTVKCPYFLF